MRFNSLLMIMQQSFIGKTVTYKGEVLVCVKWVGWDLFEFTSVDGSKKFNLPMCWTTSIKIQK